jgi:hypothetical protein
MQGVLARGKAWELVQEARSLPKSTSVDHVNRQSRLVYNIVCLFIARVVKL